VGLATGGLLLLLGLSAYGTVVVVRQAADTSLYALPAPLTDQQLLATLAAHHVTRFTSDYWTCYRLAFESGERLQCAIRDRTGGFPANGAINRYWPWAIVLRHTPYPAYIFYAGTMDDTGFMRQAAALGLPHVGYVRLACCGYAVYYYPGGQG
jgi:hypothetical protein